MSKKNPANKDVAVATPVSETGNGKEVETNEDPGTFSTTITQGTPILYRDPRSLKMHPLNVEIYGVEVTEEFVETIRRHGVQQPIQVTVADSELPDTIISGHTRAHAAIQAGITTVPCIFRPDLKSRIDIDEAIIELNRQRVKTNEQIGREALALRKNEEERRARAKDAGVAVPTGEGNRVDDVVAGQLGVSRETVRRTTTAVEEIDRRKAEGDDAGARELSTQLNASATAAASTATQAVQERSGGQKDINGQKIPRGLIPIFDAKATFEKIRRELKRADGDLGELQKSAAGTRLALPEIRGNLTNVINAVVDATPHCVCPHCKGKKKCVQGEGLPEEECSLCNAEGWVTEIVFKSVQTAEERKAAKAAKGGDKKKGGQPSGPGDGVPTPAATPSEASGEMTPAEAARSLVAGAFDGSASDATPTKKKPSRKK